MPSRGRRAITPPGGGEKRLAPDKQTSAPRPSKAIFSRGQRNDLANACQLNESQIRALHPVVPFIAAAHSIKPGEINRRLKRIAHAADEIADALSGPEGSIASLRLPHSLLPSSSVGLALFARMACTKGQQRSDPEWIGWIDDALRSVWDGPQYPRRLGPRSKAFADVVAICAEAAGIPNPKRALERYPVWRRWRQRERARLARAAALRSVPTLPAK